uniref:Immunoglobulin V-set domain-containing protein n=1 Tax=Seriola dumerili TaxID=41447 RepID=A0A3B4U4U0_SERDU
MVGETLTYWCDYSSHTAYTYKFICKGEDPSVCERLVSTQAHKMNNGKFSLNDDRLKRNITITVRDVTADDAGTYWCGAKRSNNESSNPFFHRFIMTVGESCCFIVWMKSDPGSDCRQLTDGWINSPVAVTIAVTCVAVLVLVVVVVLIVYKRKIFLSHVSNFQEIQDCLQRPDSGTAPKTVYVTANVPTNHSAFTPHSEVQNSSDEVSGDTYYNMWDSDQCPIYSTVNKASTCPEDPLYSTVDNPQQH